MIYNKEDTPYCRAAGRQQRQAEPLLQKAKEDYDKLEIDPQTGFLAVPIDPSFFTYSVALSPKPDEEEGRQFADASTTATSEMASNFKQIRK